MIRENLEQVRKNMAQACTRAGRPVDSVTLIAVSKTKPVEDIREAMSCGCTVFGENKVQELRDKTAVITEPLHWHMIGHLQTNKVKYLPGMAELIHSVDNAALAKEIEKQAAKHDLVMDVLCEVNMAAEETKFGLTPDETPAFVKSLQELPHLNVRGLMTIAPYTEDPETNRPYFRGLRELLTSINTGLPQDKQMDILSMGMTGDYMVAIEEGATMVRVGTGIFGERNYAI
ncbi:MAG: YggS family pyridoxal phosphate-dependent enzyme [Lachnospiraceae bacterium]|nr:YggS family pyridoxal phosphate-dependent enzyme [Lachnospiraceae bacterium]